MSRFLPPDHSKGDEATIGGYAAVHGRPAALQGRDGIAYSVEVMADPEGAFLLFVRWRRIGEEGIEGHLETGYLEVGATREDAMAKLRAWPLERVQAVLDAELERVSGTPRGTA